MNPAAASLDALTSTPLPPATDAVRRLDGDYIVLGVGGKMGTCLALMLRRALDAAGRTAARVTGVSRFSRGDLRAYLEGQGITTVACDLADPAQVAALPRAANVLFLAGQKFGTSDAPGDTWVQNTFVPALVARHYAGSRLVAFSTGCVYPFAPVTGPGSRESDPLAIIGEYAGSCVGRERIFDHYARRLGSRLLLFRLYYAVDLRYGVLVDIARRVHAGEPVDVTSGWFNCIWQGDACARAIACLEQADNPPRALNVTGSEKLSVRAVAAEFGRRFNRPAVLVGQEAETAWIGDASASFRLFGPPTVPAAQLIERVADHISTGGELWDKPTHFESRDGRF
ncbi:NAD-dependent epimerase/dehydratase family protein [Opitutus sp. ER46]|uniref:NAD-dependent epimerase/dehydratase family protein n=1 Tax=Opitutus sp. ER46 TaxID=2161864 RepID=UPI000D30ECD4|nr:NAD-dependent epimerase/dehydratase family protein [Opitutus sp. ER46]PTX94459.1 epimerase [Opitutus sp. ER46]